MSELALSLTAAAVAVFGGFVSLYRRRVAASALRQHEALWSLVTRRQVRLTALRPVFEIGFGVVGAVLFASGLLKLLGVF